jgi:hypothetical protein
VATRLSNLGIPNRSGSIRQEDVWYTLYQFADPDHAKHAERRVTPNLTFAAENGARTLRSQSDTYYECPLLALSRQSLSGDMSALQGKAHMAFCGANVCL